MADVPVTTTTQILSEILAPELALAFNRETRLAQILPVRAASNANGPTWVVNTGGSIARTHGDGAAIVDFNSDVDAKASLSWGNYESPFHVTDAALSDAALSANPRATNDQFARLVSESVATLAKKIETDLFSGSGSNSIIGLDSALDNANTYAGIDRASAAYFRASEFGSGSLTTLTKAQIRSDLGVITTASGERPNVAICAPAVFCKVADLFEAQRQFTRIDTGTGVANFGDSGLPTVMIDGCKFVESAGDGYLANNNGAIYYLNTNYVHLEVVPYVSSAMGQAVPSVVGGIDIKNLATTSHSRKAVSRIRLQLVVTNPLKFGRRVDINAS